MKGAHSFPKQFFILYKSNEKCVCTGWEKECVYILYIYISVTALCAYISLIFSKTNNASIGKEQNKADSIFEGYTVLRHIVLFKCLQFADEKVARSGNNIN